MDLERIKTAIELLEALEGNKAVSNKKEPNNSHPYEIGANYVIRTVTMMQCGKLVAVYDNELVLENASWIADSGRWSEMLVTGYDKMSDVEMFNDNQVIVGRNAVIDAQEVDFDLPTETK